MTDFLKQEMLRLVDTLPETDPRTQDYHVLLRSIECLDAMGQTINEIVELVEMDTTKGLAEEKETAEKQAAKVVELTSAIKAKAETGDHVVVAHVPPFTAAEFPEEPPDDPMDEFVKETAKPAPATEAKTYNSAEVRKALVDARSSGTDVKALLKKFGAANFSEVPAAKYGELMAELGVV